MASEPMRPLFRFCLGTSGELIKLAPLMRLCGERGVDWVAVHTGQSGKQFFVQWDDFGFPRERCIPVIPSAEDLSRSGDAFRWLLKALGFSLKTLRAKLGPKFTPGSGPNSGYWVIHGDTFSSLVGAFWGRRLGATVVHIESGLTSGRLFSPFPEEICRRLASRMARVCFASDSESELNLRRRFGNSKVIHNSGGNTLYDAVQWALRTGQGSGVKTPYALVNIHRYENLHSKTRWEGILSTLTQASQRLPLRIVQHPETERKLLEDEAWARQASLKGAQFLKRMPFSKFIRELIGSRFLITDGGSNQEEISYLGIPCLILRTETERREGLGANAVLSGLDPRRIEEFLQEPERHRTSGSRPAASPSEVIFSCLVK